MDYKKGDRINMVKMEDRDPIPPGTEGVVQYVTDLGRGEFQVGVLWDNGRSLSVILPEDKIELISRTGR